MERKHNQAEIDREAAYEASLELLRQCATEHGFLASSERKENYHRIFSRDSAVMGVAALGTDDEVLLNATKASITTLATHQGEHGEIPSNVDPAAGIVSYGGTAGRVDATLWFVIIAALYYKRTKDRVFLEKVQPHLERAVWLLGAWEYNLKGFLYVPATGDWADEYPQAGYALYDQALYYYALSCYAEVCDELGEPSAHIEEKVIKLRARIRSNYGMCFGDRDVSGAYHDVLFEAGCRQCSEDRAYWLPYFSPLGYGHRFDALANILVSLTEIAEAKESEMVDTHIRMHTGAEHFWLLPAFDPVITEDDPDWEKLRVAFSYEFKNRPYEYHNGGLWPMITGFYVLDLARRGKRELAARYLDGIHRANYADSEGGAWGFYEVHHGKTFDLLGTRHQGWSAAAAVIGHQALYNKDRVLF